MFLQFDRTVWHCHRVLSLQSRYRVFRRSVTRVVWLTRPVPTLSVSTAPCPVCPSCHRPIPARSRGVRAVAHTLNLVQRRRRPVRPASSPASPSSVVAGQSVQRRRRGRTANRL